MWHVAIGLAILGFVFSLLCVGMYKLSGTNNICKRGQCASNGESAENQFQGVGNVEWLELQVDGVVPNRDVSVVTIGAGG